MPYTLNGQAAAIDEEPTSKDGSIFVPFAKVVEALGGTVHWDNDTKMASATIGQWTANFVVGSSTADVNGTTVQFPTPAYDENGELYVPAEFFHNAYGYTVTASGADVTMTV